MCCIRISSNFCITGFSCCNPVDNLSVKNAVVTFYSVRDRCKVIKCIGDRISTSRLTFPNLLGYGSGDFAVGCDYYLDGG
ncbi:MAG: hypothetical protein II684_00745 [Treponema sp.]|nr:hypothetical protein [Treponema sp.]